jgi:hypothetical protein
MLIEDYRYENTQYRSRNAQLRDQIDALEQAMQEMPRQKVSFMEEVVPAARAVLKRPLSLPKLITTKPITRPRTASLLSRPFH